MLTRLLAELPDRITSFRKEHHRTWVTVTFAQSIDGCITYQRGKSAIISGAESLSLTHRLRASHDAILVGIETVLADNPQLTVRAVAGRHPQPVILDSQLRMPVNARLFDHPSHKPWIMTTPQADPEKKQYLENRGAEIVVLPANTNGQVSLAHVLSVLYAHHIVSLMVEGGASVIGSFMAESCANLVVITVAPIIMGDGYRVTQTLPSNLNRRLHHVKYQQLEEDMLIWGDWV
jgi:3,4-dihydroxy 2-butanone 4-phosphate synthase/GTP cyclohydrolase II